MSSEHRQRIESCRPARNPRTCFSGFRIVARTLRAPSMTRPHRDMGGRQHSLCLSPSLMPRRSHIVKPHQVNVLALPVLRDLQHSRTPRNPDSSASSGVISGNPICSIESTSISPSSIRYRPPSLTRGLIQILTLHVMSPRRTPSRRRFANSMRKFYGRGIDAGRGHRRTCSVPAFVCFAFSPEARPKMSCLEQRDRFIPRGMRQAFVAPVIMPFPFVVSSPPPRAKTG